MFWCFCISITFNPENRKNKSLLPHNLGYSVIGAVFLWFGWMGLNWDFILTAREIEVSGLLLSNIVAAIGLNTWVCIDVMKEESLGLLEVISNAIAGLVGIIPAEGFVDVGGVIAIGLRA